MEGPFRVMPRTSSSTPMCPPCPLVKLSAPVGVHQSAKQCDESFFSSPFLLFLTIFVELGAKQDCSHTGWLCKCPYSPGQLCLELRPPLPSHPGSSRWARSACWKVTAGLALPAFQAAWLMLRLFCGFVTTRVFISKDIIISHLQ